MSPVHGLCEDSDSGWRGKHHVLADKGSAFEGSCKGLGVGNEWVVLGAGVLLPATRDGLACVWRSMEGHLGPTNGT